LIRGFADIVGLVRKLAANVDIVHQSEPDDFLISVVTLRSGVREGVVAASVLSTP